MATKTARFWRKVVKGLQLLYHEILSNQLTCLEFSGFAGATKKGETRPITLDDMLFVAPYNLQVGRLRRALGEAAKVGSVDKFQGQEAPIVFFSLCASDPQESPRGLDFLFDKNRINVAISRTQALAIVVGNPAVKNCRASNLEQQSKLNVVCQLFKWAIIK